MDAILTKKAEELAKDLAGQATTLNELNEVLRSLMKSALERMLNTEMDVHLNGSGSSAITSRITQEPNAEVKSGNRRNGFSSKTV